MSQYGPSPRESEVLEALVSGRDIGEIAEHLSVSVFTVRNHLARLRARFGVAHTVGLVCLVWERRYAEQGRKLTDCLARHGELERRRRES